MPEAKYNLKVAQRVSNSLDIHHVIDRQYESEGKTGNEMGSMVPNGHDMYPEIVSALPTVIVLTPLRSP